MTNPKLSILPWPSISVDSTKPSPKLSLSTIVGQYTLINNWKPHSRTESLWDKAVKNFHDEWSSHESYAALHNIQHPENGLSLLNVKLEECKKNRITYKSRNGTEKPIADLLYNIGIYLKRYSGLISTGVSIDPIHAAGPWMLIQFFLNVALKGLTQFGALVDGLEVIGRVVTRYGWIEKIYLRGTSHVQKDLEECILRLYTACLRYFDRAYTEFVAKRLKRIVNSLKPRESIDEFLGKVEDAENEVQKVFTLVEAEDLRQKFSSPSDVMAISDSAVTGLDKQGQRAKISSWLKAVSTVDSYQNALKSRTPGTNSWIFERDTTYKPWIEQRKHSQTKLSKILWIYGSPGFGKSILFATIVEKLMLQQKSDSFCLAYFVCSSSHDERRSPIAILRSWIAQIIQTNDVALKIAYQVYLSATSQSPDETELWKILRLVVTLAPCILAVDGFDECTSEGSTFIFGTRNLKSQFLRELSIRLQGTNTRVLIMSRPHDDIKSALHDLDRSPSINLLSQLIGPEETTQDLLLCSRKVMSTKLAGRTDLEQEEIALQAAEKSDGMFLYLTLLCQGLHPGDTTQTLRRTVSEMPDDLDFLYERELRRILELQGQRKKQALAILRWVLFATRPLTIRELAEALALTSDEDELYYPYNALPRNWNKDFVDEAYIDATITNVGCLVELRRNEETDTLANKTVHLTHASVREYLLLPAENKGLDLGILDQFAENDHLARLCLRYLCYGVFNEDYEKAASRRRIHRFPFLFYATVSWYNHARSRKSSLSQDLEPDIEKLFNSDTKNWQLWSQIFEGALTLTTGDDVDDDSVEDEKTLLDDDDQDSATSEARSSNGEATEDDWDNPGYANSDDEEDTTHGSRKLAQDSTDSTEEIEHEEADLHDLPTPLYYAALLGLTNLVKSLTARGLDCNAPGGRFGFPLQAAIESGYSETINCLIDEPTININQNRGLYGTAISAAAAKGLTPIVKRLLDMNARLDLTDSDGCSALYYACAAGQTEIAELLLKQNKGLATLVTHDGETPIVPAVSSGKAKLIALLRRYGADINAKDQYKVPIISRAISCGHRDIVKDLVMHHADLENRSEPWGLTPTHYAAYYADDKILRLLISHKANLHAVDNEKGSVMHWACRGRSVEIVKLLIERHAPFDVQDAEGYSPLHIAAMTSPEIIPLLLDAGSNIDCITLGFYTPLMLATEYKHFEAMTLLIERLADPNIMGAVGGTVLKSLLENIYESKSKDMIRHLLERGNLYDLQTQIDSEDPGSKTNSLITPLAIFEEVISEHTSELVSKMGYESEHCLPSQAELDSALLASVTFNSLPLVAAFLQRGAKASCTNMHMQTPLHIAVTQKDCEPMVDLLIRHDAPAGARDSVCCTPLHVAVRLGKHGLAVVDKLLPTGGLFDDFDDPEALKPSEDIVRKFSGQWDGCYKYWSWSQSETTPTNITIKFFDEPSPDKWHLPWFRYEGEDGAGAYVKYGFVYGKGEVRFLKMYDRHGWYSKGKLEAGTGKDEGTLRIDGRWGESDERWHGTMEFKKIV